MNNAGSNIHHEPLRETDEGKFDHVFDVSCKAPTFLSARCADVMAEQGGGVIINLSTVGTELVPRNLAFYGAAKLALVYITRMMAACSGAERCLGARARAGAGGPRDASGPGRTGSGFAFTLRAAAGFEA